MYQVFLQSSNKYVRSAEPQSALHFMDQTNRVTVVVDTAERPEDIDEVRAKQALERAKEQLRQKQSIREYYMSKASMARALSRLKASQHKGSEYHGL